VELFPPVFDPGELVDTIRNSGAEYLFCVPTIMRSLLDLPDRGDGPLLAGVRVLQVSGAELSPHEKIEMQRRICSGFVFEYASQLSGAITALTGPDVTARPETVGRLFAQARVEIVDETGQPVPPGTVGQIRARSPRMARMLYGGRDRAQGDRIRGGWVYPGDLGALDADGFLTLSGRASDVIIRGGANVHPAEIEEFIARLPGVGEVAAVGFPSRREGEEIAVFVIRAPGATLEMNDVLSHCRAGLAPDKRPRKVIFIEELPRNANGKLVRRTLAERAAEEG
jgi:acyl-coenzyme A synthetase/AMP-(fatty) acid ligase